MIFYIKAKSLISELRILFSSICLLFIELVIFHILQNLLIIFNFVVLERQTCTYMYAHMQMR